MRVRYKFKSTIEAEQFLGEGYRLPFTRRGESPCKNRDGLYRLYPTPGDDTYHIGLDDGDWVVKFEEQDGEVNYDAYTDESFRDQFIQMTEEEIRECDSGKR
jgi:hypothetical protein